MNLSFSSSPGDDIDTADGGASYGPWVPEQIHRLSSNFVDFLSRWRDGGAFVKQDWPFQTLERLGSNRDMRELEEWRMARLAIDPLAQEAMAKVRRLRQSLALNGARLLADLEQRYRFVVIVGIPRSGGSYLTAEAFNAIGVQADLVPAMIAHDGFPDARPFSMRGTVSSLRSLDHFAEYLAAVELFFSGFERTGVQVIVPKKATKAAYDGGLFRSVFGRSAEYWVTLRHPVAACISTYEKSGGLPPSGLLGSRSSIEKWIVRDLIHYGNTQRGLDAMHYVEAYCKYWEYYHLNLAAGGLLAKASPRLVVYGRERMMGAAQSMHDQLGSLGGGAADFEEKAGLADVHPEWMETAERAVRRVAAAWEAYGLRFPVAEVLACR